jgi:excisionase family DNA binding protein
MQENATIQRVAWSLAEISEATGLSLGFLRNDVRRGALSTRKFGRRVLVLDQDLKTYLEKGSEKNEAAMQQNNFT